MSISTDKSWLWMVDMIIREFDPKTVGLEFSNKIREMCRYCKRYGTKATCPPNVSSVEYYKELIPTYKYGKFIAMRFDIDVSMSWQELGKISSLRLHKHLLELRDEKMSEGVFSVVYGAGSCKNCDTSWCVICKHPEKSIIPIEATGLNVIAAAWLIADLEIKFPIEKYKEFYRIGFQFYD